MKGEKSVKWDEIFFNHYFCICFKETKKKDLNELAMANPFPSWHAMSGWWITLSYLQSFFHSSWQLCPLKVIWIIQGLPWEWKFWITIPICVPQGIFETRVINLYRGNQTWVPRPVASMLNPACPLWIALRKIYLRSLGPFRGWMKPLPTCRERGAEFLQPIRIIIM